MLPAALWFLAGAACAGIPSYLLLRWNAREIERLQIEAALDAGMLAAYEGGS